MEKELLLRRINFTSLKDSVFASEDLRVKLLELGFTIEDSRIGLRGARDFDRKFFRRFHINLPLFGNSVSKSIRLNTLIDLDTLIKDYKAPLMHDIVLIYTLRFIDSVGKITFNNGEEKLIQEYFRVNLGLTDAEFIGPTNLSSYKIRTGSKSLTLSKFAVEPINKMLGIGVERTYKDYIVLEIN